MHKRGKPAFSRAFRRNVGYVPRANKEKINRCKHQRETQEIRPTWEGWKQCSRLHLVTGVNTLGRAHDRRWPKPGTETPHFTILALIQT